MDYYVTSGDGRDILLRGLTAGDAFGQASLLSRPIGYLGTAKAVQHIRVLEWKDRVIQQLAKTYPQIIENALRTALRYLASTYGEYGFLGRTSSAVFLPKVGNSCPLADSTAKESRYAPNNIASIGEPPLPEHVM